MTRSPASLFVTVTALLLLTCAASAAADAPEQIRHEISQSLLHHTVFIRESYAATYLHFDENGAILNGVRTGAWSSSGAISPVKIEVFPSGVLHIEAERVAMAFNHGKQRWDEIRRPNDRVVIEVQFSPAHLTVDQARKTVGAIFAPDLKSLSSDLLPYWRPCLDGALKPDPHANDRVYCFDKGLDPDMKSHAPVHTDVPRAAGGIVAAHPIDPRQPRFTDVARELTFNGSSVLWVVVDELGRPAEIYVASPVGYGLDDEAVNAIANWRFRPAKLDGKPIRTQMTVEVNFKIPRPKRFRR